MKRTINTHTDFERTYLRWRYLEKAAQTKNSKDLFEEYYKNHEVTINRLSEKFFYKNASSFMTSGFGIEDVKNFARIQLWSYVSSFSLYSNKEKHDQFVAQASKRRNGTYEVTEQDVFKKDRSIFMSFLTQRFMDFIRVCTQKNRNIRGTAEIKAFYAKTDDVIDASDDLIGYNPELYGYKKLTSKETADLKKQMGDKFSYSNLTTSEGKEYIYLSKIPQKMPSKDYIEAVFGYESQIYYLPANMLEEKKEEIVRESKMDLFKNKFKNLPKEKKVKIIQKFIDKNSKNDKMVEEIDLAKKVLFKIQKGKSIFG